MGVVKICGIRSREQVEDALAAGADLVGVILGPARRQVAIGDAARWAEACPQRLVAVLRGASDVVWAEIWKVPWAGLQVYDAPIPDWLQRARAHHLLSIRPGQSEGDRAGADILHLDGPAPGSGTALPWERVARPTGPFWLGGGLRPDNVGRAVQILNPDGVDVSSGVEVDGVKNAALMRQFVAQAREAMA